jgi:hypothetical protein
MEPTLVSPFQGDGVVFDGRFSRALPCPILFRHFTPRVRLKGGNMPAQGIALGNQPNN